MERIRIGLVGGLVLGLGVMAFAGVASAEDAVAVDAAEAEAAITTPTIVPATTASAAPESDARFAVSKRAAGEDGVGIAGRVVERFAPPVAAPVETVRNPVPVAAARGPVLRPCDTPGSGCSNVQPASIQVGVPPIVPGTRPPQMPSP